MKVALLTLGCRVNQSESDILKGTLQENGVTIVDLSDKPDYCIVNTCTVTSKGDYNSRQLIRKAARTGTRVIVTGCYSHLNSDKVRKISGVTEVIDNKRKPEIIQIITGQQTQLYYGNHSRSRPYLKVQDGCNFHCAYCSVPLARGKSVSIPSDEVLKRAQLIESQGFNEIVLTGIHLGTYGHDLENKIGLSGLVRKILLHTKGMRIRLSSLEINEIDDELLELLREERLCKHLHLPLQSGSDRILKLMRRSYVAAMYSDKINELAERIDNIAIGADIIIGFPGESERDFIETYQLLSSLPMSYLHCFPFSPRPNTTAERMPDAPSHKAIKMRMDHILTLSKFKRQHYISRQIGKELDIIIEEQEAGNLAVGTSSNYLKIRVETNNYRRGSVVCVRVNDIVDDVIGGLIVKRL